jgi:hypothetical protein
MARRAFGSDVYSRACAPMIAMVVSSGSIIGTVRRSPRTAA